MILAVLQTAFQVKCTIDSKDSEETTKIWDSVLGDKRNLTADEEGLSDFVIRKLNSLKNICIRLHS